MAATFGVTVKMVGDELGGADLTALSVAINRWIRLGAAHIEAVLRGRGYKSAVAPSDHLYDLAQDYLIHFVTARAASSQTLQVPDKAKWHADFAKAIDLLITQVPEAVSTSFDADEQAGSFRANKRLDAPTDIDYAPRKRWRRGMGT